MNQKKMRCAAIHDISGVGKCSLTVALPVLSACGVETSVLPTAILSTHTGGFENYVYLDLTEKMLPIAKHWKDNGCSFEAIYTGFLGSEAQIEIVDEIFSLLSDGNTKIIIDPVMGDHGKLYQTYTTKMADGITQLCRRADIIVPNMTEASYMLNLDYLPGPHNKAFFFDILKRLCTLGAKQVVLTDVSLENDKVGSACYDSRTGRTEFYLFDRIDGRYHGTGDLFASALTGALLNGIDIFESAEIATQFTWNAICSTKKAGNDPRFGAQFEIHLPKLAKVIENKRKILHESQI